MVNQAKRKVIDIARPRVIDLRRLDGISPAETQAMGPMEYEYAPR